LHYSGAAQRGARGNYRELQRQAGEVPPQIVDTGADPRDRRIAQVRDEIQIDQEIKRLKQHPCRNGQRHLQDVLTDGVRRQILHGTPL